MRGGRFHPHRGSPRHRLTGVLGLLCFIAQPCYAAHWQSVGPVSGGSSGIAYIDLDSVHEQYGYRIALFLTIYAAGVPNANNIRLDRITQESAFDCTERKFALRSTVGYFQGKEVGLSSVKDDWRSHFKGVPKDPFSQRALDLACNAPLAAQPEATPPAAEAAASVQLPPAAPTHP
jgi:hypothetical protein